MIWKNKGIVLNRIKKEVSQIDRRIIVSVLIKCKDKYLFIKQNKEGGAYQDCLHMVGGGLEENETLEECAKREILEEFGINVDVKEQICFRTIENELDEYLYRCEYVSGKLGTGTGPEFSNDPKYADRGSYIPVIIPKSEIKNIRLLPESFKENILKIL